MRGTTHKPLFIGDKQCVRIKVRTVQTVQEIAVDGIDANDIRRQIEVSRNLNIAHVSREVQISHRDMRTAGAKHNLIKLKSSREDFFRAEGNRLIPLLPPTDQRIQKLAGIAEHRHISAADGYSAVLQSILEMRHRLTAEGFIKIRVFKIRRAAGHVEYRLHTVSFKIGNLVFLHFCHRFRRVNVVTQKGGIRQHIVKVIKGIRQHLFFYARIGKPERVYQLIIGVRHAPVHQRRGLVRLDNAEHRFIFSFVCGVEPLFETLLIGGLRRHEFEIFQTALSNDQLDILHIPRCGIARKLTDAGNAVVRKPFLQPRIERAGLEKPVAQQHHAVVGIPVFFKHADVEHRLSVPNLVFDRHFLFGCRKIMVGSLFHADRICFKGADSVRHDENCLFRQSDGAFNAAHRQGKVRLPRCLIGHIIR